MLDIPTKAVPKKLMLSKWSKCLYLPKECKEFEALVAAHVKIFMRDHSIPITDGPVALNIIEYRVVPRSWSKKKRKLALEGIIRPIKKPDNDNVCKSVSDAMEGIVFVNDAQRVDDCLRKFYAEENRVHISVSYLPVHEQYKLTQPVVRDYKCDCGHCVF